MPRVSRSKSISGYYHIICRGVGKQIIFEDDSDYIYYLKRLEKYSRQMNIDICAYCLMDNHVHLLVRSGSEELSSFMHKMGISYAGYFNKKYDRCGHLFQNRFLSETVEDEYYLMTVFRYILNNPIAANICRASDYKWSSYNEFVNGNGFTEKELLMQLLGDMDLDIFLRKSDCNKPMDIHSSISDAEANELIKKILGENAGIVLQSYSKKMRDEYLRRLKEEGLTVRQISRLTGVNRGAVQRA